MDNCELIVLVYAYTDTQYTITVTTRSEDPNEPIVATELADGVSLSDYLNRGEYAYFVVAAGDA